MKTRTNCLGYSAETTFARTAISMINKSLVICCGLVFIGVARAATPETLLIGPGDLVHIKVVDTPELDQHPRVTDAGDVPVTGVGIVKISGLTPSAAAELIRARLIAASLYEPS